MAVVALKAKATEKMIDGLYEIRETIRALHIREEELAKTLKQLPLGKHQGRKAEVLVYAGSRLNVDPEKFERAATHKAFLSAVTVSVSKAKKAIGEDRVRKMSSVSEYTAIRVDSLED